MRFLFRGFFWKVLTYIVAKLLGNQGVGNSKMLACLLFNLTIDVVQPSLGVNTVTVIIE